MPPAKVVAAALPMNHGLSVSGTVPVCLDAAIDRVLAKVLRSLRDADPDAVLDTLLVSDVLSSVLGVPVSQGAVDARAVRTGAFVAQLERLLLSPGITQRTPEWYDARQTMVTASDIAQALGCAKFGSQKQFFQKKCGAPEEQSAFNAQLPPLKWGIMYEPVAAAVYTARTGARLHEFGLLCHPTVPHLGASPDGVTDAGVMVEIKCPWRRKITGEVPLQYYYQMQGQLEVCGLDECDYAEFEFEEPFGGADHALEEEEPTARGVYLELYLEPGAGGAVPECVYAPLGLPGDELRAWATREAALAAEAGKAVRQHWWRLEKFGIVRVLRDPEFVAGMLEKLASVWERVLRYRGDRGAYLKEVGEVKPPTPRPKPEEGPVAFAFVEDEQ